MFLMFVQSRVVVKDIPEDANIFIEVNANGALNANIFTKVHIVSREMKKRRKALNLKWPRPDHLSFRKVS